MVGATAGPSGSGVRQENEARPGAGDAEVVEARLALPGGAMLFDASLGLEAPQDLFDESRWRSRPAPRGRGNARFVSDGALDLVWREFRRGGLVARLIEKDYLFIGETRVRSFVEWRLLAALHALDLPVPRPVAASYVRRGPTYRAALMTERIQGARLLSASLDNGPGNEVWRAVGACIRRFHDAHVCHADLNAHNVLLTGSSTVHLIDFDRGRIRSPGAWREENLARLRRSLGKISGEKGASPARRSAVEAGWPVLMAGYEGAWDG